MDERMSESIRAGTRRNASMLAKSRASTSQRRVAELMGISETTLSEMKGDGKLDRLGALIAACGLKLAPASEQTFDAPYIDALRTLAKRGLDNAPTADAEIDA